MKAIDKELMLLVNEYADENGLEAVLEELFGGISIGELAVEMYNAGLIPDDQLEIFLDVEESE